MPSTTPKLALPYPLGTDPVSDGDDSIKALAERVEVLLAAAWTAPTLQNAWANNASGDPAGFRLEGSLLRMRGLVAGGAGIGSAPIFTLPAGFRPTKDHYLATASNSALGIIWVAATGAVVPLAGSAAWFSLDCAFPLS